MEFQEFDHISISFADFKGKHIKFSEAFYYLVTILNKVEFVKFLTIDLLKSLDYHMNPSKKEFFSSLDRGRKKCTSKLLQEIG